MTYIKEVNGANYSLVTGTRAVEGDSNGKDPLQTLLDSLEGDKNISNQNLVDNLISLLKAIQSLLLSLQECHSKKAAVDADIQKTLVSMNESVAEALQEELDKYLKALEEYEKNKLVNDIFGVVLPFLAVIFPPLLAIYPMGPMSLLFDPNAPFGMGVIGKEIEEKLGKAAAIGIVVAIEVTMVVAMSVLTCGGIAAIRAGGIAGKEAAKTLAKEIMKDVALYGVAKAVTTEEVMNQIVTGVIKAIEGISGKELDDSTKAMIKVVVMLVVEIVLLVVAVKVKSKSEGGGASIVQMLTKSHKLQKALVPLMFIIQGAQSGIQMWGGMNTIEMASVQQAMREIRAIEAELKGLDAKEKTKVQNLLKDLQRSLETIEPRNLDLEGVAGKPGSKVAEIMSK
jgi:hypothetical protein